MSLVLADTSVWVDHLRKGDANLAGLLEGDAVLIHPMVIGELACGLLRQRSATLALLQRLPRAAAADDDEALATIEALQLMGSGLGWIDVHLLAAVQLSLDARLWTRDRRLAQAATGIGLAWTP